MGFLIKDMFTSYRQDSRDKLPKVPVFLVNLQTFQNILAGWHTEYNANVQTVLTRNVTA